MTTGCGETSFSHTCIGSWKKKSILFVTFGKIFRDFYCNFPLYIRNTSTYWIRRWPRRTLSLYHYYLFFKIWRVIILTYHAKWRVLFFLISHLGKYRLYHGIVIILRIANDIVLVWRPMINYHYRWWILPLMSVSHTPLTTREWWGSDLNK